jgi:hypothetical protein
LLTFLLHATTVSSLATRAREGEPEKILSPLFTQTQREKKEKSSVYLILLVCISRSPFLMWARRCLPPLFLSFFFLSKTNKKKASAM